VRQKLSQSFDSVDDARRRGCAQRRSSLIDGEAIALVLGVVPRCGIQSDGDRV
jgi:hypothetical protein